MSRIVALDGLDERIVDEAELEVRPAVPHGERRRFDELRKRIERAFGLAQAQCQPGSVLLASAGVEEPEEDGARRLWIRRMAAPHFEYAWRAVCAHLASYAARGCPCSVDLRLERLQVFGRDAAVIADELCKALRPRLQSKISDQPLVGFDTAIGAHDQWPRGIQLKQRGAGTGSPEDALSQPQPSSSKQGQHGSRDQP